MPPDANQPRSWLPWDTGEVPVEEEQSRGEPYGCAMGGPQQDEQSDTLAGSTCWKLQIFRPTTRSTRR